MHISYFSLKRMLEYKISQKVVKYRNGGIGYPKISGVWVPDLTPKNGLNPFRTRFLWFVFRQIVLHNLMIFQSSTVQRRVRALHFKKIIRYEKMRENDEKSRSTHNYMELPKPELSVPDSSLSQYISQTKDPLATVIFPLAIA